ncbi:DUF1684 domain-containing protein [Hymenobacter ruricola]|uniref:DUF1684 domain-containing protein n=1 Tax=Hymenobacter ruricola TaxID=2791023 RepID=A0ABS0I6R9_9BACT|nr:DUF1684 domain-containing protein [Hymenobacter ruricola]MBF9222589.1 DUF1684 domain-containing protein [Hymenobacter ruricola]
MKPLLPFLLLAVLPGGPARAQTAPIHLDSVAHQRSVLAFQQALNAEFRNPKESPLTPAEQQALSSLPFYPTQYRYYVTATFVRDSTSRPFAMATSTVRRPTYRKYGELRFVLNGQPQRLSVYQSQELIKRPGLEDYLFLPFTDLTNGHGSYGGGRYIDLRIPPAGTTVMQLDFNKAYNPSCAYNHGYSCPVPPAENRLAVAVPVGVQSTH